jgi:hypothetical protein
MPSKIRLTIIIFFALFTLTSVSEIVSSNISGIKDKGDDYSDWIEIHNLTNSTIDLGGYYLSDKTDNPLKWQFPTFLVEANGFVLVFASEKNSTETELHTNFKLSINGENILLSNPDGIIVDQLDSIALRDDISYGYKSNEGFYKFFNGPTPGAENTTEAYSGFLTNPQLSLPSGFYPEPINVTIIQDDIDAEIRYTIDGSEPISTSPKYLGNLNFENKSSYANIISLIPTNPSFDYPKPGYDNVRANSRGWLEPYGSVNKSNVLNIKAFKSDYLSSNTISATYFINPEMTDRYSLPVISIITDKANFFSDEIGIYVYGNESEGNYNMEADEWERLTNVQFFENDGSLAFEQKLGARIHGGGGRHSTIKNIRMYARTEYGNQSLTYKFFENDDNENFERFLIRGPGHRPDCAPRDDLADLLVQNLDMDIQHIRQVIVFINGEYWGIHTIKERFDQEYLEGKYGKRENDYVILRNSGTLDSGIEGDEIPYQNLLDYVETNDMSLDENYEYVKNHIDIDNYLTYFTSEVFLGNVDWINTNIKFWRFKGLDKSSNINGVDGKWRWFLYDFDLTFGSSCDNISPNVNVLGNAFDPEYEKYTILTRWLKGNEQFVYDFVNRMCDLMNSNFSAKNINEKIDQIDQIMTVEMQEHIERWRYPSASTTLAERQFEVPSLSQWNSTLENLHDYTNDRKRKIIDHMKAEFVLEDTIHIQVDVNYQIMGNIQVNSILISEALDGVNENVYPWDGTYFKNIPFQIIAIPKLGYRFLEWQESGSVQDTLSLNLNDGGNFTAIFEIDPDFTFDNELFINEFMASNQSTIVDEYGAYADWIEIYNPNNEAVDLAAFYISDNAGLPLKYQFPRGSASTIIHAYGYKLIWADGRPERGALHTNFKLSANGEHIVLLAPDSSLVDEIAFGPQSEDASYGREKDGESAWMFFPKPPWPTPGATNNNVAVDEQKTTDLSILYPNPVSQGQSVFLKERMDIEIFNSVGQLIFKDIQVSRLETSSFNRGIYFIKTEKRTVFKLIVE